MAYFSKKQLALACVLMTSTACSQKDENRHFANVYQLCSVPEQYGGKHVVVPGFLAEQGEAYYLVASKDWIDYAAPNTGIAIEVHRDKETLSNMDACLGREVQVIAQFGVSDLTHRYALLDPENVTATIPEHNDTADCIGPKP